MFANIFNSQAQYAYVLGLYLADGSISHFPRTKRLRVSLNSETNKEIIERLVRCLNNIFPDNKTNLIKRKYANCIDVSLYNSKLNEYFPQHGKGPKHARKLFLADWQQEIINSHKEFFIAGLFDGDGSLYSNRTRNVECAQFSNRSKDIMEWFKNGLDDFSIKYCETWPPSKNGNGNLLIQSTANVEKLKAILQISYNLL